MGPINEAERRQTERNPERTEYTSAKMASNSRTEEWEEIQKTK